MVANIGRRTDTGSQEYRTGGRRYGQTRLIRLDKNLLVSNVSSTEKICTSPRNCRWQMTGETCFQHVLLWDPGNVPGYRFSPTVASDSFPDKHHDFSSYIDPFLRYRCYIRGSWNKQGRFGVPCKKEGRTWSCCYRIWLVVSEVVERKVGSFYS